jgi:methyl-accepting chemotaxis protein
VWGVIIPIIPMLNKKNGAERELKEMENIFNASKIAMRVIDEGFNITHCNTAMYEMTHTNPEQLKTLKCYDQLRGATCHTPNCSLLKVKEGTTLNAEVPKTIPDGTEIPCNVYGVPYHGFDGKFAGIIETFEDITLRKEKERELENAHADAEGIFEGSGTAMRVIDENFNIIKANQAMLQMCGTPKDQVSSMKCYDQLKGAACHNENCTLVRIKKGEEIVKGELDKSIPSGKTFPCDVWAVPYKDADGNVVGVVETFSDISDRKDKEKEIVEMKEYLERQVENLLPVVEAASRGDLTKKAEAERDDSMGKLINSVNSMVGKLGDIVSEVQGSSITVASSSEEFAASSEEMNASLEEVSSTVQQITTGAQNQSEQTIAASVEMKKMADMVRRISENAQSAAKMSGEADELAKSGSESAKEATTKMQEIYTVVNDSAVNIRELGEKSNEINEIVNVITDIAEQTNLLALNAAIEAARAGEHGRGFAVVAEEVKKLAEGSAKAADQISDLIKEIQTGTDRAVESMDRGTKEVEVGNATVKKALEALEDIAEAVSKTAGVVWEISTATEEHDSATELVVKSMDEVAAAAEEAAASTEEMAAAVEEQTASMQEISASAENLSNLSHELQAVVTIFNQVGTSKKAASMPKAEEEVPPEAPKLTYPQGPLEATNGT